MYSLNFCKCTVKSATLLGVEVIPVDVEISVFNGLPGIAIVGMPDASIKESKERIKAAIKGLGFSIPASKIVANLAPSSVRKTGSGFDLPIAVGILAATGQIPTDNIDKYLIVGELALGGQVREIPGLLAYALAAKNLGLNLISPLSNQLMQIKGVKQYSVNNLHDFKCQNFVDMKFCESGQTTDNCLDFKDVNGHDIAKRALQISAVGNHGLLMVGPPGSGKSMLASRLPSILPPLSEDERMETAVIHSVAGSNIGTILKGVRPFRHPHHSATLPGLIGGGNPVRPGEVSLAHNGVLYLDELAEFSAHALQGIRQPMEEDSVNILRADGAITFPAKFNLIAATNPCPCGYYGDTDYECKCSPAQIQKYQSKIGGPILDRIDMHLDVNRIAPGSVLKTGQGIDSYTLKEEVCNAVEFKKWRIENLEYSGSDGKSKSHFHNKQSWTQQLIETCRLDKTCLKFLEETAHKNKMSGRGITRVLGVARTIADIEQSENVTYENLCESLTFRFREDEKRI